MKNKILLVAVCLMFLLQAHASIPYPDPEPACDSPWHLLWMIEDCNYCGGGDYYLFTCETITEKGYKTIMFKSTCLSSIIEPQPLQVMFIPMMTSNCTMPGCVILGEPPIP